MILATIFWTVAILHPPHGLDLPICWWKATIGVSCPGCGLMRSVSCTARGLFADAWNYHPFGPAWLAVATAGAGVCALPKRIREHLRASREHHRRLCNTAYTVFVAAFLLHGTLRALGHFAAVQALFRHS